MKWLQPTDRFQSRRPALATGRKATRPDKTIAAHHRALLRTAVAALHDKFLLILRLLGLEWRPLGEYAAWRRIGRRRLPVVLLLLLLHLQLTLLHLL